MAGDADVVALPVPCLVVLVGPSGSGKSTWAAEHFAAGRDRRPATGCAAVVGHGEDDLDGHRRRLRPPRHDRRAPAAPGAHHGGRHARPRRDRRRRYRGLAAEHGLPCVAVAFDAPGGGRAGPATGRGPSPLPAAALKQQLARWAEVRDRLDGEGFDRVLAPVPVRHVPGRGWPSRRAADAEQRARPVGMRFGLHLSAFGWEDIAAGWATAAAGAEAAGFDSVWVMDHVRQIPQVGRDWDPMLECYTALAWLAARTDDGSGSARWSPPVTFRNVAHLAKIIATLDVLSGGRARCGLGLGWYEREHLAYGWEFPDRATATPCWRTRCRPCPCCGDRGPSPSRAECSTSPRRSATRGPLPGRTCRSWSGGGGERRTLAPRRALRRRRERHGPRRRRPPQGGGAASALPRRRAGPGRGGGDPSRSRRWSGADRHELAALIEQPPPSA